MVHELSCPTACGIFPDQGSKLCPLRCQADCQPLNYQRSPKHQVYLTTRPLVLLSHPGLAWLLKFGTTIHLSQAPLIANSVGLSSKAPCQVVGRWTAVRGKEQLTAQTGWDAKQTVPSSPCPRWQVPLKQIKAQDGQKQKTHNMQGNSHEVISWFLCRNSAGQKGVAWCSWSVEREEPTDNITQKVSPSDSIEKSKSLQISKCWENSAPPHQLCHKC